MFSTFIVNFTFYLFFTFYLTFIFWDNKIPIYPHAIVPLIFLLIYSISKYFLKKDENIKQKLIIETKETYVATVVHDLKNPLIGQIRILEMLIRQAQNNNQVCILKQLLSSNKIMLEMIMSILNTYKYSEGKIDYNFQKCNLVDLISETCKELTKFTPEENDIHLNIKTNSKLICADKMHLRRVISNLLSNAIRYRKEDTPIVVEINSDNEGYKFSVTNNGYYIKPEMQEKLFEKYTSKSSSFNKLSTGLGLYLSKKIINDHHGKMLVNSTHDGLNTFGFTIPKNIK